MILSQILLFILRMVCYNMYTRIHAKALLLVPCENGRGSQGLVSLQIDLHVLLDLHIFN